VQVALDAGEAPITVKTGEQSIGAVETSSPESAPFDIVIPETVTPGTYTLDVHIEYNYIESAEDTAVTAPTVDEKSRTITETVRLDISDDARFDVTEVDSKLFVGEEGRITGRLKNVGGSIARNAEVKFTPSNENINALSSTVAVGDIPAGDSVPFSIPVEMTSDAEAVPSRFDLNVNYRDEDGISRETDDPEFLAEIKGDRDALLVEPVNNTIPAGESRTMDLRVTNNLGETVTDIEGKFFADDPLDSSNDETFTTSLEPNETTTVTVDLSAAGGATIKNYPASVDFRYVDSEGDSKLTDSYRVAISVTEPTDDGGGLPVGPLVIGLVVVGGVGGVLWRRTGGNLGGLRDR
jgi:hypothetical protein